MLTTLTLLAGLCPLAALSADPAQSLEPSRIPADARWVVHVDFQAALKSTFVRQIMEHEGQLSWDSSEWDDVKQQLDIDPREDISSVTVYGSSDEPDDAVALIATNARIEGALDALHKWLTEQPLEVAGISMSLWEEKNGGDEFYTYVASRGNSDERLLMLSPDAGRLAAGVRVLRGGAQSMADAGSKLSLSPRPGAMVYVAVPEGLARFLDLDDAPQVARLATSVDLQLGENAGRVFAELEVTTDHAEAVQQASQILQGASALAALLSQDEPEIRPFLPLLQGLRFEGVGRTLRVQFDHDAAGLADLLINRRAGRWGDDDQQPPKLKRAAPKDADRPGAKGEGWR